MVPVTLLRSFTPFKQLLQQLKSVGREVTVARQTLANAEAIASEATRAESDALLGTHYHSLADAIEEAGGLATLFRNRISAGNHVDDLESSIVRLKTELGELEHSQVLPVGWMIALGAMFVFGATLLLSGLLLPGSFTGSFGYAIAGLGLAGAGVASVTTLSLDRSAYSKLESTRRQLLTTRRQNEETIEQCRQLDARIVPHSGLSLESRLKSSQREVDRLEAIAVRAGSSQVLSDGVKESREHLEASLANRTKARTAWKRLLVRAGFRILFHRFASENSRDSEANLSNSMMLVASRQPKQRNTENQLHTLPVESINSCLSVEIFQSHTLRLILSNYFDCDWIPTDDHYDPANACMRNLLPQETVTGDPYGGRMTLMNSASASRSVGCYDTRRVSRGR